MSSRLSQNVSILIKLTPCCILYLCCHGGVLCAIASGWEGNIHPWSGLCSNVNPNGSTGKEWDNCIEERQLILSFNQANDDGGQPEYSINLGRMSELQPAADTDWSECEE
jgi:hypothetical protein